MGWLYMQSLGGFDTPRAYLDDQFTYEKETVRSSVLRSALVRMRTYYAAVEQFRPDRPREVFAVVCLVRYNPRDAEGYVFGYTDGAERSSPFSWMRMSRGAARTRSAASAAPGPAS